jgi:phage repressor protein C with HTH and peptisase S24 domain
VTDPRIVLERLCAEHGEDFAGLSRMLGKNPAYIQQFVRRGVPKRLKEEERRKLARYFSIPETLLGAPADAENTSLALAVVSKHPVSVSAGPGALVSDEISKPYFAFDPRWLKALTSTDPSMLSIVRVEGDSMEPTLKAGDDVLVDLADCAERLREGIYVLRIEDALVVKRVTRDSATGSVTITSDNPAYPDIPASSVPTIDCIGRVIWAGRRFD